MLGKQVRRIFFAEDLLQIDPLAPDGLLYPQRVRVDMPQLSQTLARAYADCCGRVRPHPQRERETNVPEQGLVAESLASPAHDDIELGLSTAQRAGLTTNA